MRDCERIRQHSHEFLDGELEESVAVELRLHIERCIECGKLIAFEAAFLRCISRARAATQLPPEMEARVTTLLAQWRGRES